MDVIHHENIVICPMANFILCMRNSRKSLLKKNLMIMTGLHIITHIADDRMLAGILSVISTSNIKNDGTKIMRR